MVNKYLLIKIWPDGREKDREIVSKKELKEIAESEGIKLNLKENSGFFKGNVSDCRYEKLPD